MQKVASCAKGTDAKRTIRATRYVSTPRTDGPLLFKIVDEQTARAVNAVSSGVVGTAQLGFVLGVARRYVKIMKAMGELTAFGILARTSLGIAAAELRLVAGGAEPWGHRRRWRLD